jgi:hypothetical protein
MHTTRITAISVWRSGMRLYCAMRGASPAA